MSPFDELVTAIERHTGRPGRRNGKHIRLLCPAHDDHHPSLDVADAGDGTPLVACRSHGCSYDQIIAAVGLDPADLHRNGDRDEWTPHGPAVATYRYIDERGALLFEVCRTADKQFPQRRPDPTAKSGWRWKLDGARRVLYRLPELLAAVERGDTVYLVEGEKDADRLHREGLTASCNPGGAGKWSDSYAQALAGADVVVIADRDLPGYAHARRVARSLEAVGASVTLRQPAVDKTGADVSDHLAAGRRLDELEPLPADTGALALNIVSLAEFVAVDEPGAEPILGTPDNAVIPEGGDVMVYGDGGVGKTTLCVDLACHLAAGDDWLGIPIPRPYRVLLVENEGPRPLFRRKLARKLAAWTTGSPIDDRIQVLEEPWGELDFADPAWRAAVAAVIASRAVDVLVIGPLTSIGMEGAGTIAEARAFIALVDDVRTLSARPIAVILVHHENKGGKVSGAWEGVGDTLIHVQQQGHGKVRLYFQKARWASEQHATTLQLKWAAGDAFELDDASAEANRPERTWRDIADYVLEHGPTKWGPVRDAVAGETGYLARRRDAMLEEGVLINAGTTADYQLWHRDDPARPRLVDEQDDPS